MIAAMFLLLLAGLLAIVAAAIVGWQLILVGLGVIFGVKVIKKLIFKNES